MTRTIRRLGLAEIAALLDWAAAEGWNPGLHDAEPFQSADPNGFFGAFVDDILVAGIAAVAYDDHFGFIGLYICHPAWRGQGHGKAVWDAGMAYLGRRTIGLDGVPEQQANYARMGFVPAYETVRMSGILPDRGACAPLDAATLDAVGDLDGTCFPAARPAFLQRWLAPPHRSMVHRGDGKVDAYAVLRPCREGSKIGPLFSISLDAALAVLDSLAGPVQLDVPLSQADWLDALVARGFATGFRTRRMYRGTPPKLAMGHVLAVSSLELG